MIFFISVNIKYFYKLIVSFLLIIVRYAQSTQNIRFVISLQYLKKEGRDEVDFLHENRHQIFKLFKMILLILVGMAMSKLLLPPYWYFAAALQGNWQYIERLLEDIWIGFLGHIKFALFVYFTQISVNFLSVIPQG